MESNNIKEIEYVANVQVTMILKRSEDPDFFDDIIPRSPEELEIFLETKNKSVANIMKAALDADDVIVTDCKYFEKEE